MANNKTKWLVQTRGKVELFRIGPMFRSICELGSKITGSPITTLLFINKGRGCWWCWSEEELIALGKKILSFSNSKTQLSERTQLYDLFIKKALTASENIIQLNLSLLSKSELVSKLQYVYEESKYFNALLDCDIDAFDLYPVEYLQRKIRESLSGKDADQDSVHLMTAICGSYVQYEEKAMSEGALRWLNTEKSDVELENIAGIVCKDFWWTGLGWESMEGKSVDFFKRKIRECATLGKEALKERVSVVETDLREKKERRREMIKKYAVSDEIVQLLEMFDTYAEYHDKRKEVQMKIIFSCDLLRKEILKYVLAISIAEEWFWPEEMDQISSMNDELSKRKDTIALYLKEGKIYTYSDEEARKILQQEIGNDDVSSQEIKGMVAHRGIIVGIVRVCKGAKEAMSKVKSGDILITGMTLPDYVPAMRRAGAIVTNEGGITCHAAIISRELKKPCIIGTKIATKVLKDGDLVEVDAERGVVTILQRGEDGKKRTKSEQMDKK